MDTLFHFFFSLMAGMAVFRGERKHKPIILLALLSVLIDMDHFFGMDARGTFHNIFIILLIPLIAFFTFYTYEGKKSIRLQTCALILLVMLTGHVTADMFYGGEVKLFYPFSSEDFPVPKFEILTANQFYSPLISRDGIALAIYFIIMLLAFFVEDLLYLRNRQRIFRERQNLKKAINR